MAGQTTARMKSVTETALLSACFLAALLPAGAQEWTRFRGPNGTGLSTAKTVPTKWTADEIAWKVSLPGAGHSSPVIWGNKVFLTTAEEAKGIFSALCLDTADGRVLWRRDFKFSRFEKHNYNSFASTTPTVDEQRLYVAWTTPAHFTLAAFDHNGNTIWEKDLGPFVSQHNGGASPILYEDKIILANEQDGDSFLIGVEATTGATRWKTPRQTTRAAYGTPCVFQPPEGGPPVLVFTGQSHGVSALDPENGRVVWEYATAFDKRSVSSPVIAGRFVLGSCGSGGGGNYVVAIRPGDAAQNKKAEIAWQVRRSAPYVPTSIAVGDLVFLWSDGGVLSCVRAPTGEVKWQERVGGDFFGSPVCVDGRLFCVSVRGEVVVAAAADKFAVLARNPLDELCRSTPAVAGGKMFIRTASHLFCIGGKAAEAASR